MKYIAAYALCALATPEPTKTDIETTLAAAGITTIDSSKVDAIISQMKGKKFDDLVAEGQKKLVSGGGNNNNNSNTAAPAAAAAGKAEAPKAKVVAPPSDDEDDDMGSLF